GHEHKEARNARPLPRVGALERRESMSPILVLALLLTPAAAEPARDGWVVLPVQDYQALRAKAYPPERPPDPPPLESIVSRVDYDLKVVGDSALGEARLTVDVLREGWARIPVPAGLSIRDARADGRSVPLTGAGNGK